MVSFASAYAVGASALYLWGYWGTFKLNALEFMGLGDIVGYALFPFLASSALLILTYVYGHVQGYLNPPPASTIAKIHTFVQTFLGFLLILDAGTAYLIFLLVPEPDKWWVMEIPLFLFFAYLAPYLISDEFLKNSLPNTGTRNNILTAAALFALIAFAQGRSNGFLALRGEAPMLVDGKNLGLAPPYRLSYVGHISNRYVLFDVANNRLLIFNSDQISPLVLIENPNAAGERTKTPAAQPTHDTPVSTAIPSPRGHST